VGDLELSDDEESEDEETRLQREEEEQERELSRVHGEASEGRGEKRQQTAEEIQAQYEKKAKSKRQKRPDVTVDMITGANGLIRIPHEFKQIPHREDAKTTSAAAAYSLRLIEAYKQFCFGLAPNMAFEDVLIKIEKEGSGRQLKDYIQNMRNMHRNHYVEKLYGKEKAEQFLSDLDMIMGENAPSNEDPVHQEGTETDGPVTTNGVAEKETTNGTASSRDAVTITNNSSSDSNVAHPAVTPMHNRKAIDDDDDDDEEEEEFDFGREESALNKPNKDTDDPSDNNDSADEEDANNAIMSQANNKRRFVLEDSSDEDEPEAKFADIAGSTKGGDNATGIAKAASKTFDDSDDESEPQLHAFSNVEPVDSAPSSPATFSPIASPMNASTSLLLGPIASPESAQQNNDINSPSATGAFPDLAQTQTQPQSLASTTQSDETATIIGTALTTQSSSFEETSEE
jgi:hypothetical protein